VRYVVDAASLFAPRTTGYPACPPRWCLTITVVAIHGFVALCGMAGAGMVLAASDEAKTRVSPITPPSGAVVGERLFFGEDKEQVCESRKKHN
jgi:hypothetical protein